MGDGGEVESVLCGWVSPDGVRASGDGAGGRGCCQEQGKLGLRF